MTMLCLEDSIPHHSTQSLSSYIIIVSSSSMILNPLLGYSFMMIIKKALILSTWISFEFAKLFLPTIRRITFDHADNSDI